MARKHARHLLQMPSIEIAGWCSASGSSAAACAAEFGGVEMAFPRMLAAGDIDAVLICTPPHLHFQNTMEALRAGKRVFCEKPIALRLAEADELVENGAGRIYAGHVLRFFHAYNRARQLVLRGDLGEVKSVACRRLNAPPAGRENWYFDASRSGGVLLDLLVHDFDWLLWTFGAPAAVRATACPELDPAGLTHATARLRWTNGLEATVEGSWQHEKFAAWLAVEGTAGKLEAGPVSSTEMQITVAEYVKRIPLSGLPDPYLMQMKHFAGWLRGLFEGIVTVREARNALALSLQAQASL